MIKRIKRLKKIRLHREGTDTLLYGFIILAAIALLLWRGLDNKIPFWFFIAVAVALYGVVVNFFRCPIRYFPQEDTENIVVAPADGRIVVIEEVDEDQYFHEKRIMISIFMSLFNVHANWFPVDGHVKHVGKDILCRQIAGAMARRIVTYAKEGEECYIDEHLGFIKFGSRVDVYLPLGSEVCVKMGQSTTGDQTIIAKLK